MSNFAYKRVGNTETLKGMNVLSKSIKAKPDCSYRQDMVDKMVLLLIREELHHFYQAIRDY